MALRLSSRRNFEKDKTESITRFLKTLGVVWGCRTSSVGLISDHVLVRQPRDLHAIPDTDLSLSPLHDSSLPLPFPVIPFSFILLLGLEFAG